MELMIRSTDIHKELLHLEHASFAGWVYLDNQGDLVKIMPEDFADDEQIPSDWRRS